MVLYIFNAMVADDLVMQGARVSAAMVPTQVFQNILVSAPDPEFIFDFVNQHLLLEPCWPLKESCLILIVWKSAIFTVMISN